MEETIAKKKTQAQVPRPKTSRTFVNFERAKKQQKIAQVSVLLILYLTDGMENYFLFLHVFMIFLYREFRLLLLSSTFELIIFVFVFKTA